MNTAYGIQLFVPGSGVVPGPDNKSRVRSSSAGVSRAKTPQPGYQALAVTHTTPAPIARNDNIVGMSASRGGQLQLSNPPPSMAAAAAVYGTTQRPQSAPKWRIRPTADATGTTFANSAFKSGNGPALAWGNGGGNSDSPSAMLAGGSNGQQARWLARSGSDPAATVATFTSSAGGSDPWSSIGSSHLHNSTGNQRGLPASPLLATGSNGRSQGGLSRGMHGTTISSTSTTSSPYINLSSTAANNNKASVQQQQQHGSNSSSSNATRYAWEVSTSPSQPQQQQHRAGAAAASSSSLLPQAVSPTSRQPPAAALPSTAASAAPVVGRPRTAQGGPVAAVALPRVDQHPQQHHQQFVAGQQPIGNSGVIRTAAGADGAPSQHNSAAAQLLHHQHHINSNVSNRMPTSSGPSAGAVADRLAGLPAGRPMQQVAGNANHAQHGGNAGNAMFGGGGDDDDDTQMDGDDGGGGGLFNGHQHHHGGAAAAATGRAASRPSSAAAQQQPQPHQHQLFSNIAGSNNIGIGNLALHLSHASNNNPNSSNPYGGGGGVGGAGGMPITGIDISSLPSDEQDAQRKALQRQLQREREWLARQKLKQTVAMPDFDARATTDFYGFGKVLGQGSFGEVRLAWHRLAGQKVAIKSYEKSKLTEPNHWRRVQQEIRLMERLNHPHIIRELEMIDSPKRIHIVMEYAGGGNLCSYVKAKARLGEGEARKIFLQLLAAVEYMHENGIIHRDIKLENVLFDEDQSNVKLTDFGFSVMVRDPMKRLKIFCGTPSYMAPEITQRREYLGRPVDVWSLAVLLYACLAGHFPFTAKTYPELYKKIAAAQVKFPDHISAAVKDLLRRMLHPDPMKRLTLAHARMHPWVAPSLSLIMMSINAPADNSLLVSDDPTRDVNEAVLQRCEQLGFKRQRVLEAVLGRVKNACSTTYYLVLARAGRSAKAVPSSSSTAPAGTHGVAQGGVTGGGAANQQQGIGAQMLAMQQQQYQQQQQQQLMLQRPATAAPGVGGSGGAGGLRGGRQPAATGSASGGGGAIALLPPSTNMPINSHHHQQQQYLSSYAVAATGLAQGSDGMEVAAMLNNQHLRGAGAGSNNNVGHGTGFASAGYSHLTSEGSSSQGGSTASHYLSSPSAAAGSGAPTSAWRASASGPSSGAHSQHARPGSASRPITNGLSSGLTAGNVAILTSTTSSTNNNSTSERTGHAGAGAHGILGMGPEDSQESDGMDAGGGPMMVSGAGKGLRPMAGGNYSNHDGGGGGQQQRSRSAAPASRPRSAMPLGRQAGAVALQATGATTGGGVTTSAGLTFGYAQGNPAVAIRRPSIGSSNYSNNGDMFSNTSAQARQPPPVASNDTSSSNGGRGPMTVTSWSPSKALGQQAAAGAPAAQASQQQQRSSSPINAQRSGAAAGTAGGGAATMLSQQQQRPSSASRTSSGATAAQPALPAAPAAATHAIMRPASASRPLARPGSASSSASSSASAGSTSAAATSSLPHDHRPTVIDIASLSSVLSAEAAAAAAASNAAGAGAHRSPIMQQQQVKPSNTSSSAQQQQQQQPLSFLDRIAAQQQQQARSGSSGMDASGGGAASGGASGAHLYANSSNGSGNGKGTTSFSPKASSSGGGTLQQQQPTSPTHHNSGSGSGPIRGPSALLGSPLVMPQQYNQYHHHQQQQYQDYSSSNSGSGAGHVHSNAAQAAAAHNLAAAALQHGAGSSSGHVGPVRPIRPTSASSQAGRLL